MDTLFSTFTIGNPFFQMGMAGLVLWLFVRYVFPTYRQDVLTLQKEHLATITSINETHRQTIESMHTEYVGSLRAQHAEHKAELREIVDQNRQALQESTAAINRFDSRLQLIETKLAISESHCDPNF